MSGVVGIIKLDGAPVEADLLRQMTEFLASRGPDAQRTWVEGSVGFGHAMLRTEPESAEERQPAGLDGRWWITAHARLDEREALKRKLEARGSVDLATAPDVELILHAYRTWEEDCVHHLAGDFIFAIWDTKHRRLFCARDHFGLRPLFYAQVGQALVLSNNLDCVRLHPAVSDRLNEQAIANFLVFHHQPQLDITTFADIQRLLPAHTLTWSPDRPLALRRYWTLPVEEPIHYRRQEEYVEHFLEVFDQAVEDRVRGRRAAVHMSGGMDSTSVAATAHMLLSKATEPFELRAYTAVYDRLIPDRERHFAGLVADHLGIPIHFVVNDDHRSFEGWDAPDFHLPEPTDLSGWAIGDQTFRRMSSDGMRVCLSGHGCDPLFMSEPGYAFQLVRRLRVGRLLSEVGGYVRATGKMPFLGIRTALKRWARTSTDNDSDADAEYLAILDPAFAERVDLSPNWWSQLDDPPQHAWHPKAYEQMIDSLWPIIFQHFDERSVRHPLEFRFPYFDHRVVNFLLRVSSVRWGARKELLRVAMHGRLPEEVRLRPKAPLAGTPVHEYAAWVLRRSEPSPHLLNYVNRDKITRLVPVETGSTQPDVSRLIALDHWLRQDAVKLSLSEESS